MSRFEEFLEVAQWGWSFEYGHVQFLNKYEHVALVNVTL